MDLIFEPPWYLLVVPVVAGIGLLWQGNARQNRRLMYGGLGAMLLGITIWLLGSAVETDREAVIRRTHEVAQSVDKRDWNAFGKLMDDRVQLSPVYNSRDDMVKGATMSADHVNVRNITLSGIETKPYQNEFQVDFQAIAGIDMTGQRPFRSNWRFYWRKLSSEWLLYRIEPLPGGDVQVPEIMKRLLK